MSNSIDESQLSEYPFEDEMMYGRNWIRGNFYLDNPDERLYRDVWMRAFKALALSSIRWEGVPAGIDKRAIEYILLHFGQGGIFQDSGGFLFAQSSFANRINIYYNPNLVMLSSPSGQWWYRHAEHWIDGDGILQDPDCAICWDNMERVPLILTLKRYATRIAKYDYVMDMNIDAQLTPWVIAGKPDGRKQMSKMQKKLMRKDRFWPVTDTGFNEMPVVLQTGAPFVADKIEMTKQVLVNEVLTLLGYDNTNVDKKERVQTAEVLSNNEMIMGLRESRLKARQLFCERVSHIFGIDIQVEWGIEGMLADIASVMRGGGFESLQEIMRQEARENGYM